MTGFRRLAIVLAMTLTVAGRGAAQLPCVGDCNDNYVVAINELITCVNIALGNSPVDTCPSCDTSSNGVVAINELIQAVNAALNGCERVATPTPTPETGTPTATSTPDVDIENVAGAAAAVANAVAGIPNLIGAIFAGVSAVQSAASTSGIPGGGAGDVDPCELGGTVTEVSGLPNLTLVLDACRVARPGGSVLFDGTLNVSITNIFALSGTATFDAAITFFDDAQQVLTETTADLTSNVVLAVQGAPGGVCTFDVPVLNEVRLSRLDLNDLMGTLNTVVSGEGTSAVTWMGTNVSIAIDAYSDECVPIDFDVTVNGDATIERQGPSAPAALSGGVVAILFDVTFDDFVVSASGDGNSSLLDITGNVTSSCIGDTVTLSTPQSLSLLLGTFCPSGGTLTVQDIGDIVYSPAGVAVGGATYESCLDPALLECLS